MGIPGLTPGHPLRRPALWILGRRGQPLLEKNPLKKNIKNSFIQLTLDGTVINNATRSRSNSLNALSSANSYKNSTKCNPIAAKTCSPITWQQDKTPKSKRKRKEVTTQEQKKRAKAKTNQNAIPTSNRFEILDVNDDGSEKIITFIRTPKPEPIFVMGVTNITELKLYLNSLLGEDNIK